VVYIVGGFIAIVSILFGDVHASILSIIEIEVWEESLFIQPHVLETVVGQFGFNNLWIGALAFVSSFLIWNRNKKAVLLVTILGGFSSIGFYFFYNFGNNWRFNHSSELLTLSFVALAINLLIFIKNEKIDSVSVV